MFAYIRRFNLFFTISCLIGGDVIGQIYRSPRGDTERGYFTDTRRDARVQTNILVKIQNTKNAQSCVVQCMLNKECKAINFNKNSKLCELLGVSLSDDENLMVQSIEGWIYYGPKAENSNNCGIGNHENLRQSYGGHTLCCPKGRSGNQCQYQNFCAITFEGFCTDKEGNNQTNAGTLIASFGSNVVNMEDKCLSKCRKNAKAQGCELQMTSTGGDCRVHTKKIGVGVPSVQAAACWKFEKSSTNTTYTCRYGHHASFSQGQSILHTIDNIDDEIKCYDECMMHGLINDERIYNVVYDAVGKICKCYKRRPPGSLTFGDEKVCIIAAEEPMDIQEGLVSSKPAVSCKRLKERYAYHLSGFYWIVFNNQARKFWCDMETDGGGWMLIAHTKVTDSSTVYTKTYNSIKGYPTSATDDFAMYEVHLIELYSTTKFTEVRLKCRKQWHGRQADVVFSNHKEFLDGIQISRFGSDLPYFNFCEEGNLIQNLRFLPSDTSLMKSENCTNFYRGRNGAHTLYRFPFFSGYSNHISIDDKGRMECDDFIASTFPGNPNQAIGEWWYYIR